jgi:hypothetical protein
MARSATTKPRGRGYSWASATPGNLIAVKHAGESDRAVAPTTEALLSRAVEAMPVLREPQFAAELEAWCRAEAHCRHLTTWLEEHGHLDDKGEPRRANDLLLRWKRRAAGSRDALGLSLKSHAQLGLHLTQAQRADMARFPTAADVLADPVATRLVCELEERLAGLDPEGNE